MIESEIVHTSTASKRIFDGLQDILEFFIVFGKLLFEVCCSLLSKIWPPELKDISGEIVLITGTGHGIGKELALHYVSHGCTVVCVDINEKGNEETVKRCNRINSGAGHNYICDVSDRDQVQQLQQRLSAEIGNISVLINNVGIMPTHPLESHTPQEIRRVFDINVLSQFWTLEAFLPQMKKQGRGHIIAISSIAGVVGLSNLVPYCATKFAVRGMMEALMEEIRESPHKGTIKTTLIYPYMTNTGLCKYPRIKFPSILNLLDPKEVARQIVDAHRRNLNECTIPSTLLHINNFCRILPHKCGLMLKDYIDSGVESDL